MEYTEAAVKDIFVDFLKGFKDARNELKYRTQISSLPARNGKSVVVDYPDLLAQNTDLATSLVRQPELFLKAFDLAALETLGIENPVFADKVRKELHVRIRDLTDRISLREVTKNQLNMLIQVAGMVTRTSELSPLAINAAFRCSNQHLTYVLQTGSSTGVLKKPPKCEEEGCGETKNFELDEIETEFIDFQIVRIQEMPEELPPGQLPQSFDVHLTGDVVNTARPGDRIVLTGIVKAESNYTAGSVKLRLFNTSIEANFVEQLAKRPEDLEIEREDEEKIRALAAAPGAYDRLIGSVAPAIFGNELQKEAALLLMVGSPQKKLPDGSTLRGDVNILLVGDPGCLVYDERIVLGNGAIAKIGQIGQRHLQPLNTSLQVSGAIRSKATRFHVYRKQPIIEIVTESGKSIKGTHNHPLLARKRDFGSRDTEWRSLEEMALGDKLVVSTGIPCTITRKIDTGFKPVLRKSRYGPSFKGKLPAKMIEDLAAFCGYMLGDGWVRESNDRIEFVVADTDKDILPVLLAYSRKLFGIEPHVRERIGKGRTVKLHYVALHSKDLSSNLAFLKEKRIPDLILRSGNSVAASFLRWLYEADGCVFPSKRGVGSISLKAKDIELLRDVQILLLRFGVHSRIVGNALVIRRSTSVSKFAKHVGFASSRKRAVLKILVKDAKLKKRFSGQRLERVVKIRRHPPQDVYDVEVPNGHRFIANGIFSHNTAKSELLKYVARIAPRGLYTSGRGSTAAGLTAAVVKEKNGMMMLEAGATVLADLGIACIDEFDKMRDEDRSALHEVMEQQTASVAKGGIIATLNARTSIFAAANPVDGKYDPYKNILDNVALPVPLLTRFDLIFIIRDEPDPAKDENVAKHILDMRAKSSFPITPSIDFDLLKKYVIYAKKLDPELTEEARNRLSSFYIKMRREASPDQLSVTPRWLEGLIRLSIARARVLLHPRVTEDDALHAINLMERMLQTVAVDQATKKVDIGVLYNKPVSEKGLRESALEVFKKLSGESKQPVQDKAFYEELEKTGKFTRDQAEKVFQDMWKSGIIYESKPHYFKKA